MYKGLEGPDAGFKLQIFRNSYSHMPSAVISSSIMQVYNVVTRFLATHLSEWREKVTKNERKKKKKLQVSKVSQLLDTIQDGNRQWAKQTKNMTTPTIASPKEENQFYLISIKWLQSQLENAWKAIRELVQSGCDGALECLEMLWIFVQCCKLETKTF